MTVSITATPTVLVEEESTQVVITLSSDEPIPEGGLVLTVSSETVNALGQFDVLAAQPENVQILGVADDTNGFRVRLNEQTGTITLPVFDDSDADSPFDLTFSVEPGESYTVDESAGSVTLTIEDAEGGMTTPPDETPDEIPGTGSGLPLVSLNTGPKYLVEEDGTVSAHVFNITEGTIPSGGLLIGVEAPNLSEFNLDAIEVSDGGEVVNVRSDGFDIRLNDFTTLVDLPVAADGEAEGVETANFSLEVGDGYEVNSDLSGGSFSIVDTASEIPAGSIDKRNDILPLATSIKLSEDEPTFLTASINFDIGNRYLNEDETYIYVDATEDVDFYSFELSEGDVVAIDGDVWQRGEPPTNLAGFANDLSQGPFLAQRIFDSEGNELVTTWASQGPGELFASRDGYLEFVAPENGTYYLGLSNFLSGAPDIWEEVNPTYSAEEKKYDPFVPGGGNNGGNSTNFLAFGEYDITIDLNPETILELPQFVGNRSINNRNSDISVNPELPTVSLDFLSFTLDSEAESNLVSPYLTEGTLETNSALVLTVETEGEIPEEGILINVNSDSYLRQYVTKRGFLFQPFTPGSELETLLYDETGRETGFQLRVFEPYTFVTLNAQSRGYVDVIEPDVEAPEDVTWFLESAEGYNVASDASEITATYYDPDQVPEPTVIPEVGISISETQLIESEKTSTTLKFTLSEPPPAEGVIVQINGSNQSILPQFDIFNLEIDGGVFPSPDSTFSGFYFKITEQEASITLPVFEDPFDEGLQSYSFSLQEAPNYIIANGAGEAAFTIADNPDSVVEVSLSSESETLVESENPTGVLTFNLTANPTIEGVTVNVNAPDISEFDVNALSITGGEITEIIAEGFSLNITDATAVVDLPVLSDGEAEGLETATFSLAQSTGSTINPDGNEVVIALADNPNQVPVTEEFGGNDTIELANDLNLNSENLSTTLRGSLSAFDLGQGFGNENDAGEDVDIYKVDLQAGDSIKIDIDSIPFETVTDVFAGIEQRLDSELRLFDVEGNELASVNNAAAPNEEFSRDPYLEFTAEEAGSYYVGVSQLGNDNYDPNVEGSGSGWIFPKIGVFYGEYDLSVSLTQGNVLETPTTEPVFGSLEGDIIEVSGTSQLIFGGDSDDLIDASISSTGNNRIYAGSGEDTAILGISDRIIGGEGADKFFATTGGDNVITGGEGADQFWIASAEISDTANIITDFTSGEDVLGIAGLSIGFDDLSITQQEDNTLIAANGSDLAILQGISADSLIANNFAFA